MERFINTAGKQPLIKCVVWDLDNTLWRGTLLEDERVELHAAAVDVIKALDERGILQSIASKNDHETAMQKLHELGLQQYFLYPQINWNSKALSIRNVAQAINIGHDAIAFIDDQPFERAEVEYSLPEVRCIDPTDLHTILDLPEFKPRFITEDSRLRRSMYISDVERRLAEDSFSGTKEEFLATLEMKFTIADARDEDFRRAEELTIRTHQLNSTGCTYSYDELKQLLAAGRHLVLIASLADKFGTYGKVGLAVVERDPETWNLKLLLMSCRVISRGVGTIMLNHITRLAKGAGVCLRAEYVPNGRNRMMYVAYKFAGFRELERRGDVVLFEHDLTRVQNPPDYVEIEVRQESKR